MYTFKVDGAEAAIREYQRKHPSSKAAAKALNGDCAAMMELYEKLCGPIEQVVEEGPSDEATDIIFEAVNCKYVPAMVRFAQDTMCLDSKYWPDGLMMLMEAYELGSQEAMTQLQNDWHNCVKDIDAQYRTGESINRYEEFMLAFYYHNGIGTAKDEVLAQKLFQLSAKHGCVEGNKFLKNIQIVEVGQRAEDEESEEIEKPCGNEECERYILQCGGDPESAPEWICARCGGEGPMRRYFDQISDDDE